MAEQVLSVSQFLDVINELIAVPGTFVRGEVTGFKVHPSGVYLSLKDKEDGSILDCYINPYVWRGMGIVLEDGIEVKVGGMPSVYKPKGRFSFRVETLEPVGEGSLRKAYELLKKQLEQEGLFARKRPLPEFIKSIGVVTSRTGAVIDDFRKNLDKRGYRVHLADVRVEGTRAVENIIRAVRWFNRNMPDLDVLVVIRGGGSLEDLQPFNNELVARELFASHIPTLCSIGHDRDAPIAQLVADAQASTPTATAMLINGSWEPLVRLLPQHGRDVAHGFEAMLSDTRPLLDASAIAHWYEGMLDRFSQRLLAHQTYLDSVSPERNLQLGYSIITDGDGEVIKDAGRLRVGQDITARFARGAAVATVEKITHG